MRAIILAGGKGTRLRPITLYTPKPIVPIANRPLLAYQLELLKRAGVRDVIISLSYQPQRIEHSFIDGSDYDVNISYAIEASPQGTAGAYRNAASDRETTLVLNGDIITDVDLGEVISFHRERGAAATIVLAPAPDPTEYGMVEADDQGRIIRFLEKPKPEEVSSNTVNAGIYVLEPKVLDYIPEGEPFTFEYGVFPKMRERGEPLYGYLWRGYWCDVGTPASYLRANLDALAGKVKVLGKPAREIGEKFDPRAELDDLSVVDPSCTIKSGAQIVNSAVGRNCYIEERALIEGSVIRSGSRIGAGAIVRGSVIGQGCHIGRSACAINAVLGDKSVLTDYSQTQL